MGRWGVVAAGALAMVGTVACSRDIPGSGPVLLAVDGRALVASGGDTVVVEDGDRKVDLGDDVTVVDGEGTMTLPDGSLVTMRAGRDGRPDSRVEVQEAPILRAGDILAATEGDLSVVSRGVEVALADGTTKVRRDLTFAVQVYDGRAVLRSADRAVEIPALRQASVPSVGVVPTEPSPLVLDRTDAWDVEHLGTAIDLNDRLDSRARGLTATLPAGQVATPGFIRSVLTPLARVSDFSGELVDPERAPGETMVGAAITVAADAAAPFADRWTRVFGFRDQGAGWGLVVLDQAARGDDVFAVLDDVVLLTTGGPSPGPGGSPPTTAGNTPTTGGGTPTTSPTTTTKPGPTTTTTSTTVITTPTITLPGEDDNDILQNLLDGLGLGGGGLLGGVGLGVLTVRARRRDG